MQAGLLSREMHVVRGADVVSSAEGNIDGGVMSESLPGPAWSENHGMYGTFMRENLCRSKSHRSTSGPHNGTH